VQDEQQRPRRMLVLIDNVAEIFAHGGSQTFLE
jgi:hypothetical protein